jgi:hypothetical protein
MLFNLLDPVADALERLSVCDVVHQKNPLCAAEV